LTITTIGYTHVDKAADGVEALERLRADRYDFVISDINMPRMNGFQLLRAIKSDELLRHLPVLIVSTDASRESVNIALRLGALDCFAKPVAATALQEMIRKVWG
jgi:two-component system, chemotaxis family, chemotaxis protein CheY